MQLNDLLRAQGLAPETVLVFRHRPREPTLRRALPWLAAERHDIYNTYQSVHDTRIEGALQKASFVASFIGTEPGKGLFVGLYRRGEAKLVARDACLATPEFKALAEIGWIYTRESFLHFDLDRTEHYQAWSGRLVVDWPPPERSWWRWADRNAFAVSAIHEHDVLCAEMPSWDRLVIGLQELTVLPRKWQAALAEWRGIYLIFDAKDAKAYVGSACGSDNILGRWRSYIANGHGGNVELKDRNADSFRFSILQRVSPDLEPAEVIALEASWKERLHTREFGLNAN